MNNSTTGLPLYKTPTYSAQCVTARIAAEISGRSFSVCNTGDALRPPFCLRTVREYRTPSIQSFRDAVAAECRARRAPDMVTGQ